MYVLKYLLLLIVPGILFSAALYLKTRANVPVSMSPLLELFPFVAVAAGLFLGWRFNRSRVFWAIALLITVERCLVSLPSFGVEFVMHVAPVLLLLNLVVFDWWSERGLLTIHGVVRLVSVLLQLAVAVWLYSTMAGDVIAFVRQPLLVNFGLDKLPFPQMTLLVMLFSVIALLVRFYLKPEALEGAFCWVAAAVIAGFLWPEDFAFWGGVASFILAVALIESSFKMAFNDELTGLPARRAMNEFLLKVGRL